MESKRDRHGQRVEEREVHRVSISTDTQSELVSTNYIRVSVCPGFRMQQQPPGAFSLRVHAQHLSLPATAKTHTHMHTNKSTHTCRLRICMPHIHAHIIISSLPPALSLFVTHTLTLTHTPSNQPNAFPPCIHKQTHLETHNLFFCHCLPLSSSFFLSPFSPEALHPSIHPATPYFFHALSTHTQTRSPILRPLS